MARKPIYKKSSLVKKGPPIWQNRRFVMAGFAMVAVLAIAMTLARIYKSVTYDKSYTTVVSPDAYDGPADVTVPLAKEADFSDVPVKDILAMRQEQADSARQLLSADYKPTQAVFDKLEDTIWWMTIERLFYFGKRIPQANTPTLGAAASRSILNPLLLAKAEFWGLSIWGPRNLEWSSTFPLKALLERNIPLAPRESMLIYFPKKSEASVTYDVSDFLNIVSPYLEKPLNKKNIAFGLYLQNAHDLGFRYLVLDRKKSSNIKNRKQPDGLMPINDFYGALPTAWDPKVSLNHMSPSPPNFDWIDVTDLPASAVINLWRETDKENSGERPPDFIFTINIK